MARIKIGETMYVFTPDNPKGKIKELLISAHGGYVSLPGTIGYFTVPKGTKLYFFGPHKYALKDPGVMPMFKGQVMPGYSIPNDKTDKCMNYILQKYQGKHGNVDETYEYIERIVNEKKFMDVLTIRNRWYKKLVTLKEVLSGLAGEKRAYSFIYCSFCRIGTAQMLREVLLKEKWTWDASKGKKV